MRTKRGVIRKREQRYLYSGQVDKMYMRLPWVESCVYCNGKSQITNRIVSPKLAIMMNDDEIADYNNGLVIVPSCRSCAAAAQDLLFRNVAEKKTYIQDFFVGRDSDTVRTVKQRTAEFMLKHTPNIGGDSK